MTAAFYTLGCKLNQCETEALADAFVSQGFSTVSASEEADLYVINTCTVTTKAEQKARRVIRKISRDFHNPPILVTGCYAQLDPNDIKALGGNVHVLSMDQKASILELPAYLASVNRNSLAPELIRWLHDFVPADDSGISTRFNYEASGFSFHSRAFLKIQDGCNNSCAYCRVCIARGKSVSLDSNDVLKRLKWLAGEGYLEIVLTGVNLSSYQSESDNLASLLGRIIKETEGFRIRLSSLEPEILQGDLVPILAHERICPHFHIPVQSGSDKVLGLMKRRNNAARIRQAVRILREIKDDPFIAADVITGFPGETEEDFLQTETLVKELDFSHLHIFPYSNRPGTAANEMKPKVPERISRNRAAALQHISVNQYQNYCKRWQGEKLNVIIEKVYDDGSARGMSENYLDVHLQNTKNLTPGDMIPVLLQFDDTGVLKAEII